MRVRSHSVLCKNIIADSIKGWLAGKNLHTKRYLEDFDDERTERKRE